MNRLFFTTLNNIIIKRKIFDSIKKIHQQLELEVSNWSDLLNKPTYLVAYGYIDLIKQLIYKNDQNNSDKHQQKELKKDLILQSILYCKLNILDYLLNELNLKSNITTKPTTLSNSTIKDLFKYAANSGSLEVNLYLVQQFLIDNNNSCTLQNEHLKDIYQQPFTLSPFKGDLQLVRWYYEKVIDLNENDDNNIISRLLETGYNAIYVGKLDIVQFVFEKILQSDGPIEIHRIGYIKRSLECGFVSIADWILNTGDHLKPSDIKLESLSSYTGSNHLECFKWCRANSISLKTSTTNFVEFACQNGDMELVLWINDNYPEKINNNDIYDGNHSYYEFTDNCIDLAVESNSLDLVKWLHKNHSELGCSQYAMTNVAFKRNLEMWKWFESNRTEGFFDYAFERVCEIPNNLEMVTYLHDNRTEPYWKRSMTRAAISNNFEVVKFLNENRTEGCDDSAFLKTKSDDIAYYLFAHRLVNYSGDVLDKVIKGPYNLERLFKDYHPLTDFQVQRSIRMAEKYLEKDSPRWIEVMNYFNKLSKESISSDSVIGQQKESYKVQNDYVITGPNCSSSDQSIFDSDLFSNVTFDD